MDPVLLLLALLLLLPEDSTQQPRRSPNLCPCASVEKCVCAAQRLRMETRQDCYNRPACVSLLTALANEVTSCFNRAEISDMRRKQQERQCLYHTEAFCGNGVTSCSASHSNSPELRAYVLAHSSDRGDDRVFESLSQPFAKYKRCVRQCLSPSNPSLQTRLIWNEFKRRASDIGSSDQVSGNVLPFSCANQANGCVFVNSTAQQAANSKCRINSSLARQKRCQCLAKALRLPETATNCSSFRRSFNRIRYKDSPRLLPFDGVDFPEI